VLAPGSLSSPDSALDGASLCAIQATVLLYTVSYYSGEEMRARNIHVGKVGAIGLVQVVICLEERSMRRCDHRLKERMRRNRGRLKVYLVNERAKDAYLCYRINK